MGSSRTFAKKDSYLAHLGETFPPDRGVCYRRNHPARRGSVGSLPSENNAGQSTVPASAQSGAKAISAGIGHNLALDDITPPARVELFDAEAGDKQVSLSWDKPQDADSTATRVLRSTTGFATGPEPSETQSIAYEGAAEAFTDIDLENGTAYYYTAFAGDDGDTWSARDGARGRGHLRSGDQEGRAQP